VFDLAIAEDRALYCTQFISSSQYAIRMPLLVVHL
jgi:hypothetical protein